MARKAKPKLGNQRPRIAVVPKGDTSDGDIAIELAEAYGIDLLDWQKYVVRCALSKDKDDNLAATSFCLSVPRQNGKTMIIVVIILYALLIMCVRVLYTAHHGETANEVYLRLADIFESYDELDKISHIYRSAGRERIDVAIPNDDGTESKARVQFRTRTNNTGRGISKINFLIYDEAQTLTDNQAQDLDALTLATGNQKSMTIYAGTPPKPNEIGDVFIGLRDKIVKKKAKEGIAYLEWSVDELKDPHEEKWWYETNPSLGTLISPRNLRDKANKLSVEGFNRENLGYWAPTTMAADIPIKAPNWRKCATKEPPKTGIKCFAVKFTADGENAAISVAVKPENTENRHIELIEFRSATTLTPICDWFAPITKKCAQIIIDGKSKSADLAQRLENMGVPKTCIWIASTSDIINASSMLESAINEGQITHWDQQALNDSALMCARRSIGALGGWGWQDTQGVSAAIIESAALAYFASRKTKRNPNRKGRIR